MKIVHRCPQGARPPGLSGPDTAWGDPGKMVKVAGEERWGRVFLLWRCCGIRTVHLGPDGAGEHHAYREMPLKALENPYSDYPSQLPPEGHPVPDAQGRLRPFGVAEVRG